MKRTFAIVLNLKETVILGVTSIMPNLNGFLVQTENRNSYVVDEIVAENIDFKYVEDISELPENYTVKDCRG